MAEPMAKPAALRVAASVILGVMVGGILFLIVASFIGLVNDQYRGLGIPIDLQVRENMISLAVLVLLVGLSIAYFWWRVETTPPSVPGSPEIPDSELPDE